MTRLVSALRLLPLALLVLLAACAFGGRERPYQRPADVRQPTLALDHAWIAVPGEGEPERAMLEAADFRISAPVAGPTGALATIRFENGHLTLVRSGAPAGAAAPFGVGLTRTPASPASLPLEDAPTAGGSTLGLHLAVPTNAEGNRAAIAAGGDAAAPFLHGNGARRLTGLRVSAPTPAELPPSASFVNLSGAPIELIVAREWLMELELDHGAQNQSLDLRPRMPLVVRF